MFNNKSNFNKDQFFKFKKRKPYRYHKGHHVTWEGYKVYYRSGHELDYIKKLDTEKIPYVMESLRIQYYDTQKRKKRFAIPDIVVDKKNTIIEIKSTYTYNRQNMVDKMKQYRNIGYLCILVLDKTEYLINSADEDLP